MKTTLIVLAALSVFAATYAAEEKAEDESATVPGKPFKTADWAYDGNEASWADLYPTCGTGKSQSPIDVPSCHSRSSCDKPQITVYEASLKFHAEKNNYAVECDKDAGPCSEIHYGGKKYSMLQMHAHSPSENNLNGESYPLGLHMVHATEDGDLAVLGVVFKVGKHNEQIEAVIVAGEKQEDVKIDLRDLYWEHAMMCTFSGSLTTPPCTEGVTWFVSWGVHEISADQLARYQAMRPADHTNRPIQPANDRDISCTH